MAMAELSKIQQATLSRVPLHEISENQKLPLPYLEQIFSNLRKKGLVKSLRGPSGGYSLAKAEKEISILEIISAVEAPLKASPCPALVSHCLKEKRYCLTHGLWEQLNSVIYNFLNKTSLADVTGNEGLCSLQWGENTTSENSRLCA